MITTSSPNLDIVEVSASHNAGDACPSFSLTVKPHLGTTQAVTTHLAWTPPNPLTITVDGLSWECVPLDVPIRISASEVVYQVNYYPRIMHILRRAKLKKPAVWISAPTWEQNVYLKDIDTETYQIFTKDADVYASNGYTVQEILQDLSGLCGFQFLPNFPELHVSQKSLMCDENTPILDFIGSLLPSGFRFVWDMRTDGVTISLLSPPIGTSFAPPTATSLEQITPPVETYDSVSITGAPYKLSTGLSLGGGFGSQAVVSAPAAYEETLPEETGELNGQPTRTTRTRIVQPDPFNTPFAIPSEAETGFVKAVTDRRTLTDTAYENQDAVLYETPRVTGTTRTVSGRGVKLTQGIVTTTGAVLLSEGFQIMTAAEYQAASSKPKILLSASMEWVDSLETTTDSKGYVAPESASKVWPEGTEQQNVQTTTCKGYLVNGRFFKRATSPSAILQEVGAMLQQTNATAIATLSMATRDIERVSRTLRLQAAGAYRFEEVRQTLDPVTDTIKTTSAMLPVNSDPPTSPTRWRTAPLTAVLDKTSAAGNLVFRLAASVPTSNPRDFETWATRLFYDATHPRRVYSLATTFLVPQGFLLGGGMVTGWSASQKGNVFSATLTIE